MAPKQDYEVSVKHGATRVTTVVVPPPAPGPDSEFARFEALAGKLTKIQKSELDDERAKS